MTHRVCPPCPLPRSTPALDDPTPSPRGPRKAMLAACAAALALSACGGGGSGSNGGFFSDGTSTAGPPAASPPPAPAPAPAPAPSTIQGIAASGAPFSGARLTVVDQKGATVCDTTVSATGAYVCELPAGTLAPLVVTAVRADEALYSVAATNAGTVNVTPLTTIIVARLAPQGDPAKLSAALTADPTIAAAPKVQAQVDQLLAVLKPLLDALGIAVDPIGGSFAADGTGPDRVLDTIAVSIRPNGAEADIEITVRTLPAGNADAPPVAITFRSSDAVPPTLPAVAAGALPPSGLSQSVSALAARITACYALPRSQRVNASDDTSAVTGGAADVKAPACRTLFAGNDPANYLSGGSRVGRDASNNGSFAGLFRPGATGAVFDQAAFEHYRPGGDIVFSYRSVDTAGNATPDTLVARSEAGVLKLIGNQYAYSASVRPAVQERDFVNAPASSYYNVGYDIGIANQTDTAGRPIFSKVVATAPDGAVRTLVPTAGSNSLRLLKANGTISGTSIIRLNAAYRDATKTGSPSAIDTTLVYASPLLTDAQIAASPDQGVWSLEFFHADTARANVVQTYRTITRAPTLAEAAQLPFARLTPTMRTLLQSLSGPSGAITFAGPPSSANPNVVTFGIPTSDAWAVPALAVAPTTLTVFGSTATVNGVAGLAFDDNATVPSTARSATVVCSPATVSDTHCSSTTGVTQYAQGDYFNYLQLSGRNLKQTEFFEGIALYRP